MFVQKDNEYAVECGAQVAPDCDKHGDFCESEEDAQDWVEMECWIFSGENWICSQCNSHFMRNLVKVRRDMVEEKKTKAKEKKDINSLEQGIDMEG